MISIANYGQKEHCSLGCAIALNVELSDKECELANNWWWKKKSAGFTHPSSGICRTRMYDKFRPRYSADVHWTYSFVHASFQSGKFRGCSE